MRVTASTEYANEKTNLTDCIRSGLALTGRTGADVILYHLEVRHGLKLEDVPKNPRKFAAAMGDMFGDGAKPIFLAILRELLLCSYRGVEFTPLAAALTDALGKSPPAGRAYLGKAAGGPT
jgi:hypothetical protein